MSHSGDTNKMVGEDVSNEQMTAQATPDEELRRQILSQFVPKNEREWWAASAIERLELELNAANERIKRLRDGIAKQNQTIEQACGKVLGYPWFKDDQKNFPGSTEKDGVCVGDHVAETIVCELVGKYTEALARIKRLDGELESTKSDRDSWSNQSDEFAKTAADLMIRIQRLEECGHQLFLWLDRNTPVTVRNDWIKAKEAKP